MVRLTVTVESGFVSDGFLETFLLKAILSGDKPPAGVVDELKKRGQAVIDSPYGKATYKLETK